MDFSSIDEITLAITRNVLTHQEEEVCQLIAERLMLLKSMHSSLFINKNEKTQWQNYLRKMYIDNQMMLQKYLAYRDSLKKSLVNYNCLQCYLEESISGSR